MNARKQKEKRVIYKANTRIGIIEKKYGIDLGVKPNMQLSNYLTRKGYPSLASMLRVN